MKIVKISEEIKEQDITIKKMMTMKLINSLSSLFETYLIILSQKAKDKNKLHNL